MPLFEKGQRIYVGTPFGRVFLLKAGNVYFVPRHGEGNNVPPHKINHRANMSALKKLGVKKIISVNSCGSLKPRIKPPVIIVPNDYICFSDTTFFDKEIKHISPGLDELLRGLIIRTAKRIKIKTISKGVYFQTTGPRFETKSEIAMLSRFADVVGMTMANEATLAKELGLSYASICSVDNYANGVKNEKIDYDTFLANTKKNFEHLKNLLMAVLEQL
jgi:5'-methylthioadenosine phosphorylase